MKKIQFFTSVFKALEVGVQVGSFGLDITEIPKFYLPGLHLQNVFIAATPLKCILVYLQVITPFRNLVLCAESRKEMEEWISALKQSSKKEYVEVWRTAVSLVCCFKG